MTRGAEVKAVRFGGADHGWLQRGDLIVDITADQFPDQKERPVIVTHFSAWHSKFKAEVLFEVAGVENDDSQELPQAYDRVRAWLDANEPEQ